MWPSPSRITGRSEVTPSMGLVTMYMCSQACRGTVKPLMRPSSRADAPAALRARGLARLGLEAAVEIDAVANKLGQIARGAELAHEAGGVPRGPSREAPLLEHDHVTPPQRGQVIGDAGADDATADDDDARLARKRGHRERLRARSKMSKLRRRRPGGRSPRRSLNTSGTVCSDSPPWERRGASSPERSCLATLVPMTSWRRE